MTALYYYRNQVQQIDEPPSWIKKKYTDASYWFNKEGKYYILVRQDGVEDWDKYIVNQKVYKAVFIGTSKQVEVLRDVHSKIDGFEQLSLFD